MPRPSLLRRLGRCGSLATLVLLHHLWFAGRLTVSRFRRAPTGWRTLYGASLARLLEALGPLFVKGGQLLATRMDLVHPAILAELARLQTRVRAIDWSRIAPLLRDGLPAERAAEIEEVETQPIAAGAIAQVHVARLTDGRRVAVKVRRPGVAESVALDLSILDAMAGVLQRIPGLRHVPVREVCREVGETIRRQTTFDREREHMRRVRAHFGDSRTIVVPEPVERLSSDSVLVMDLVAPLRRLTDVADEASRTRLAQRSVRALYQMIFTDGYVHADLHPGNIWAGEEDRVVILDFGVVGEMTEADRHQFVDFFLSFVDANAKVCADVLVRTASGVPPRLDRAALEAALLAILSRYRGRPAHEFEVSRFAYEMFEVQRKFRVRSTAAFMTPILALIGLEGTLKRLHGALDFQREARPFLFSAVFGLGRRCE